jgi:endonuclease YncB( thermonuclease family)
MTRAVALHLLATALLRAAHAEPPILFGKATRVSDGDSIVVTTKTGRVSVRLHGIDCPEDGQPFGDRAAHRTSELVLGKTVRLVSHGSDDYGRLLARAYVDDLDVNLNLVSEGLAWHFKRYSSDAALARAESAARTRKAGLWADASPIPPWDWRWPAAPSAGGRAGTASGPLRGNTTSHVVHAPGCPHYGCARCTAVFADLAAARKAGYRPATCCLSARQ